VGVGDHRSCFHRDNIMYSELYKIFAVGKLENNKTRKDLSAQLSLPLREQECSLAHSTWAQYSLMYISGWRTEHFSHLFGC
jgi:hypothetical protein